MRLLVISKVERSPDVDNRIRLDEQSVIDSIRGNASD
jgi:hypothetical protein